MALDELTVEGELDIVDELEVTAALELLSISLEELLLLVVFSATQALSIAKEDAINERFINTPRESVS